MADASLPSLPTITVLTGRGNAPRRRIICIFGKTARLLDETFNGVKLNNDGQSGRCFAVSDPGSWNPVDRCSTTIRTKQLRREISLHSVGEHRHDLQGWVAESFDN